MTTISVTFASPSNYNVEEPSQNVALADFDKDKKIDLVISDQASNQVSLQLGDGNGSFGSLRTFNVSSPYLLAVGDFNGDDYPDLANLNPLSGGIVSILLNDRSGGFDTPSTINLEIPNPAALQGITVGDFNGDGKDDISVKEYFFGKVYVLPNQGSGSFGTKQTLNTSILPVTSTVGDFNGDGKLDFVTVDSQNNNATVKLDDGNGGYSLAGSFSVGSNPVQVAVGDFNSDGKLDLVTANTNDNSVSVLLGEGNGSFGTAINFSVGCTPNQLKVADFNGDGKDDIAVAQDLEDNSITSILLNNTIIPNPTTNTLTQLINSNDDIFDLTGTGEKANLKVSLKGNGSKLRNELGVFTVDDAAGTIDGIAPGQTGYAEAALERSQVIFSAISNLPNGFNANNVSRILVLDSGIKLRFYLIKDSTTDAVLSGFTPISDILFSDPSSQQITEDEDGFTLSWRDSNGDRTSEFKDLVVKIQLTDEPLPLGTDLQGEPEGEVLDLRNVTQLVKANFVVNREAIFNNFVGFYTVTDEDGGIDTNGDANADILPGQAGYAQAAVRDRIAGIDLLVSNQGTANLSATLQPGSIFVPFIIANGIPDALLDSNTGNDPAIFFPFLGANSDKMDHVRLLGNNTFGFEDLSTNGDKDYNDIIVKVNLTLIS